MNTPPANNEPHSYPYRLPEFEGWRAEDYRPCWEGDELIGFEVFYYPIGIDEVSTNTDEYIEEGGEA